MCPQATRPEGSEALEPKVSVDLSRDTCASVPVPVTVGSAGATAHRTSLPKLSAIVPSRSTASPGLLVPGAKMTCTVVVFPAATVIGEDSVAAGTAITGAPPPALEAVSAGVGEDCGFVLQPGFAKIRMKANA